MINKIIEFMMKLVNLFFKKDVTINENKIDFNLSTPIIDRKEVSEEIIKLKSDFIKYLKDEIGHPYALGGGQMLTYKGYNNKDDQGNWVGFDCCGGIMYAIRQAANIKLNDPFFPILNVPGMMKAEWLQRQIDERELLEGDLIFVDVPGKDKNRDIIRDKNGDIVYGVFNHVMTYVNETGSNIITTEGEGGDFRLNPKSNTKTIYWNLESFKKVSERIFKGKTRYNFRRINWNWFLNNKKFWE